MEQAPSCLIYLASSKHVPHIHAHIASLLPVVKQATPREDGRCPERSHSRSGVETWLFREGSPGASPERKCGEAAVEDGEGRGAGTPPEIPRRISSHHARGRPPREHRNRKKLTCFLPFCSRVRRNLRERGWRTSVCSVRRDVRRLRIAVSSVWGACAGLSDDTAVCR